MAAQILVVGCGAIGGLFAAALSSVADVCTYDADPDHVRAINARGLRIGGSRPQTVRIAAANDPGEFGDRSFDVVLFLVKSKLTAAALGSVRPLLPGKPVLATLQNGMGNAEVLLGVPNATVIRGVTMNAGRYVGPGEVDRLISGKTWIGPARGAVEQLHPLAALLNAGGMETEVIADPMGAVWSKFVFNCVMNPLGALMMGDNAARYDSPDMRKLIDDMAAECIAVVGALGGTFAFPPMEFVEKVRSGEFPVSQHAGSMALDIARGAQTEIDELTGFIVREGERLNVAVPNCKAVYRLVKGLEQAARRRTVKAR